MHDAVCNILLTLLLAGPSTPASQPSAAREANNMKQLLSLLDLDRPELQDVKRIVDQPQAAGQALLAYYRTQSPFRHPVDRSQRTKVVGRYATPRNMKVADDAMRHALLASPSYPPHPFGDRIDWSAQPVPDNEWRWQLHRMSFWPAMGRAYWHTGDEAYAREWTRQFLDWTAANPRDEQHHYAWRSIEAGIRGCSWIDVYQHFIDSPQFTPEVLAAFLLSCADHADYLYDVLGKTDRMSNWRLMEAEGLAHIAMAFPEFKHADRWLKRAIDRLNLEIGRQIRRDGMHFEQCLNYHTGCIRWFARTAELARLNGRGQAFPPSYHAAIEKMCEVLLKLGLPDGSTAQFGDDHSGVNIPATLSRWADFFDRDDFRYVASNGKKGKAPAATAFALPDSGFYSMRSGWGRNATCLILKCGLDGGWHCQPDNTTFEIYADGRRLTPDSGTYIYGGDAEGRAWFRQTKVHQTLTLNGDDSAYAPQLRLFKTGDTLDTLVVENHSYEKLTHRRAVFFVDKRFFVVVDDAIGPTAGSVDVHFQLAPVEALLDAKTLTARTCFADGANLLVAAMPQPGLTMIDQPGQVSFNYGHKQPRPAFCFRLGKDAAVPAVRFVTLLIPFTGDLPEAEVQVVDGRQAGSDRLTLAVRLADQNWEIGYDLPADGGSSR